MLLDGYVPKQKAAFHGYSAGRSGVGIVCGGAPKD
jgi:hypothetical protein